MGRELTVGQETNPRFAGRLKAGLNGAHVELKVATRPGPLDLVRERNRVAEVIIDAGDPEETFAATTRTIVLELMATRSSLRDRGNV